MIVRESIEFQRGLDPKKSLGLGIREQILDYARQKCQEGDFSWSSPSGWKWEIQEDKNIPLQTKYAWFDYLEEHPEYLEISMDEHGNILDEAINFERGVEPKKSMGLGIEGRIKEFMDDFANNGEEEWLSDLILKNLSPGWGDAIDDEIRREWIEYLIKKGGEWTKRLDENDYIELKDMGIEWIPYIPIPGRDFKYQLIGNNYTLQFNGWEEFAGYFDTGRDLSSEFIENVLTGDAHDDFWYDSDAYNDVTDLVWHIQRIINKGEEIPALKDLKDKAIDMGGDPDNMETPEDLFNELQYNDDLHDLKQIVIFAYIDAQQSADESEAYKRLKEAIQKWYDIGEGKWEGEGDKAIMIAPISKEGLEKLFYSIMTGEDKIKYYPPDQGYSGDMTKDDINDTIYNKIEDL